MKILFATTNPSKLKRYSKKIKERGIDLVTLKDLNIDIDVEETGDSALENAIIKAEAYYKLSGMPTIAIDESLTFDNVPQNLQPGTCVRRVNGKRLNDKEMLDYYIDLVNKYGTNGKLNGSFTKAVAVHINEQNYTFILKTKEVFTNQISKTVTPGYPLSAITYISELNKFKSELIKEESEILDKLENDKITNFIIEVLIQEENLTVKE